MPPSVWDNWADEPDDDEYEPRWTVHETAKRNADWLIIEYEAPDWWIEDHPEDPDPKKSWNAWRRKRYSNDPIAIADDPSMAVKYDEAASQARHKLWKRGGMKDYPNVENIKFSEECKGMFVDVPTRDGSSPCGDELPGQERT